MSSKPQGSSLNHPLQDQLLLLEEQKYYNVKLLVSTIDTIFNYRVSQKSFWRRMSFPKWIIILFLDTLYSESIIHAGWNRLKKLSTFLCIGIYFDIFMAS